MKKPMTLADQVRDAQRIINTWSQQKRELVRLEGSDIYQSRFNRGRESCTTVPRRAKKD